MWHGRARKRHVIIRTTSNAITPMVSVKKQNRLLTLAGRWRNVPMDMFILHRLPALGKISLACLIYWAMFWNGLRIAGMRIIKVRRRMVQRGKKPMAGIVVAGWFGAVRGAAIHRTCDRLSASGSTSMEPASSWVFVSPGLFDLLFFVL